MAMLARAAGALIFLLAAALPASAGVLVYGSAAWTNEDAALRAGPGKTYDEIGAVAGSLKVRVERCTNHWCAIRTDTAFGWVSLENLDFGQRPGGPIDGPRFRYSIQSGGPGQVCFYTGTNYTGTATCSPSGFVVHDLVHYGLDNAFASVSVDGKVSVQVCRDFNFKSYCEKIVESRPKLDRFLHRSISSYRVF